MSSIFSRKDKGEKKEKKEGGKKRIPEEERVRRQVDEFTNLSSTATDGTRMGTKRDHHEQPRHRRRERDTHDTHADTHHDEFHDEGSDLEQPPPEAEESLCVHCGDLKRIIYIDPETKRPYPQKFEQRPEVCDHCGQVWPRNKPYSERMKRQLLNRLRKSPHYKKFSCGCDVAERSLNGRKRALLIGIDYLDQTNRLHGCKRDVERIERFLTKHQGFKKEDIRILVERWEEYRHPTREEIIKGMEWLVQDAQPGDSLFLHYSGHGGQTKDFGQDEPDGQDEGIYPVDYHLEGSKGILKDDDMHRILTDIQEGVQLTAIFDSCHSGSVLDLPFEMNKSEHKMVRTETRFKHSSNHGGRLILWSGCLDHQKSAETKDNGQPTGAMSTAFVEAHNKLTRDKKLRGVFTYKDLYDAVQVEMERKNLRQKPQLSSTDEQFLNEKVEY